MLRIVFFDDAIGISYTLERRTRRVLAFTGSKEKSDEKGDRNARVEKRHEKAPVTAIIFAARLS